MINSIKQWGNIMSSTMTPRTRLINQLRLMLGDQIIDLEADPEHFNLAIDLALDRYRQRSDGSVLENFFFLTLEADKTKYTLPPDIQDVQKIHRRGVGVTGSSGINFDPFSAALNNYFLLQWGQTGGLATWELFSQYKETLGRVFTSEIAFIFNRPNHELTILRNPKGNEEVVLTVFQVKPEDDLITDVQSAPWIRDYALAQVKYMIGEARSIFSNVGGPNGAVTMNGDKLKEDAKAEMERLEKEILNFNTSDMGWPFTIG